MWRVRACFAQAAHPGSVLRHVVGAGLLWLLISSGEMVIVHRRLDLVVAGLSLVYVLMMTLRKQIAHFGGGGGPVRPLGLFTAGSLLGMSQTVANSGAPLPTLYFVRHQVNKAHFVAAQLAFLLVQNLLKPIPLVLLGVLHLGNAGAALLLLPLTLIGSRIEKSFYQNDYRLTPITSSGRAIAYSQCSLCALHDRM